MILYTPGSDVLDRTEHEDNTRVSESFVVTEPFFYPLRIAN